jgi:hypothetical protein
VLRVHVPLVLLLRHERHGLEHLFGRGRRLHREACFVGKYRAGHGAAASGTAEKELADVVDVEGEAVRVAGEVHL